MDNIGLLVEIMKGDRWVIRKKIKNIKKVITISQIDGCNFKRVGTLEFDFSWGTCNTYQFEMEKMLFCFHYKATKQCHL